MKKLLFGLSAKVVLAIAVCSTLLTACYEKAPVVIPDEPTPAVYYLVGSLYDGATSKAISGSVTVNGEKQSGSTFNFKISTPGTYTLTASADGYIDVTREIVVVEVPAGQVSVNRADVALFNANGIAVTPPTSVKKLNFQDSDVAELISTFGAPADAAVENGNLVTVKETEIDPVEDECEVSIKNHVGFIMKYESDAKALDIEAYLARCIAQAKGLQYGGKSFEDWKTADYAEDVQFPGKTAVGYKVKHTYAGYAYEIVYDGVVYVCATLEQLSSNIAMVFGNDSHDSHDNHGGDDDHEGDDSHGDSHDGHDDHNNHGGSNAGGGAGDAE